LNESALNEFELIARYFTWPTGERQGVGDDCALIDIGNDTLAITTDVLVEHTHFFSDASAASLGHKALAVSLSDLAACGARPRCFLLSLSLPQADPGWLQAFSESMRALAAREGCELIGGDTTRSPRIGALAGPVAIGITAIGEVDRACLRSRSGARAGDDLWVSGELGEAALAVAHRRGEVQMTQAEAHQCRQRLDWPQPRVALGLALRGVATAAIDLSDGLIADLGHVVRRSGVGATVRGPDVPRPALLRRTISPIHQRCVLAGGDDYELLFAAPPARRADVEAAGRDCCIAVTCIGQMTSEPGLRLAGEPGFDATLQGYDHFAAGSGQGLGA
jgi:thiamine-monophosphate kinase